VFNAVVKVRQWWANGRAAAGPAVPFELTCTCGRLHSGYRKARPQTLLCSGCGAALFVFPVSPLPPPASAGPSVPPPIVARPVWFWPAVGAGSTFLVVAVLFTVVIGMLRSRAPEPAAPTVTRQEVEERWAAGRKAWANDDPAQAARDIAAACELLDKQPGLLPKADERRLRNQLREAQLLADWPGKSLGLILEGLANLKEEYLAALVRTEFKGKAVFFDGRLARTPEGNYEIEHQRGQVGPPYRLDLRNFSLLAKLPLHDRPRCVFGGRLAEVRRERGSFVVLLEPDSGALLTDPEAVRFVTGEKGDDALRDVIRRQALWVSEPQ